jgi:extracellular factor (EF) 3-hydroxypalmitic acid methyl ester biosynthesis protein
MATTDSSAMRSRCRWDGISETAAAACLAGLANKRFVLTRKMFHSVHEMSKVFNGNGNGNGANGLLEQAPKKTVKPPASASASDVKESQVTFQTAEGVALRGTPVRVTRHGVVFELYNPGITPRLSEVLGDFQIILQGRAIYSGRAVVRSVVEAGSKAVCEATLDDARWLDVSADLIAKCDHQLVEEFDTFVKEWQKLHKVLPEFKEAVTDIRMFLTDLRIWLEQVELGIHSLPEQDRKQLEQAVIKKLSPKIIPLINGLFERFELIAARLDEKTRLAHRVYIQRQLHPMVLCAPFAHRAYQKPLGYAGDYEMVNMMTRNPQEGASLFAKVFNVWLLQQGSATAHRNRLMYLTKRIEAETFRVSRIGNKARIFNFACGPAVEIQQFLDYSPLSEKVEFTLLDFDSETLAHTQKAINDIKERLGWRTSVQFQKKAVHQLIKESQKLAAAGSGEKDEYDFIYCAGLFDYLNDYTGKQLIKIFHQRLAPGGLLVVTNVTPLTSNRGSLELILDWNLIYRDAAQLEQLCLGIIPKEEIRVKSDKTGINIFLEARKLNDG